jgi:hypothetical protein
LFYTAEEAFSNHLTGEMIFLFLLCSMSIYHIQTEENFLPSLYWFPLE